MGFRNPYAEVTKARQDKAKRKRADTSKEIEEWRAKWREAGPIKFAEEVLACPPDVPPHPDFGKVPEFIVLSEDQRIFLYDLWKELIRQFILTASRGAGKTFVLAIYACWRVCCFDDFSLTVMGGTGEQSEKIKEYIDFWRRRDDNVFYCINRSVASGNKPARIESRWGAYARFPACSDASARGPHVTQLLIDEVCAAEKKGKVGQDAIKSAKYQLVSSSKYLLGYTSTAQNVLGTFYDTWQKHEELQFKRYRWSIARHTSEMWFKGGTKEPNWDFIDEILIKDKNPEHWVPTVWWVTQEDLEDLRRGATDNDFLVEVLGGISRGSGLVFGRDDLDACICDGRRFTEDGRECEVCDPYTSNCPMMKKLKLTLSMISNRKEGVDFGETSPSAVTVTGKRGKIVFVLYNDERTGERDTEISKWVTDTAKEWSIWEIMADPENRSMREGFEDAGYSAPHIWAGIPGDAKMYYVRNLKKFVEFHFLFIPKKFFYLTDSMKGLAYDDRSRIRKHNDHSFDSLLYAMVDYECDAYETLLEMGEESVIKKMWD